MYHSYFGLKEVPFSIKVNPGFLYMTQQHRDALATLLYGASAEGGFALLSGEVGTGKTTLIRALLQQLPDNTDIALVMNPAVNPVELLATICDELKVEYSDTDLSLKKLTDKLHHYLLEQHSAGRSAVLLIDEAQHLEFDSLEQVRLLTNLETDTEKLLQIILVGQPELEDKLLLPELRQLAQRITARFNLGPLSAHETAAYIQHRLEIAGQPPHTSLFPEHVVERVHKETEGVPRLINVLCDRLLLGTYAKNKRQIEDDVVEQSILEVFGAKRAEKNASAPQKNASWLGYLAVAATSALAVAYLLRPVNTPNLGRQAVVSNQHQEAATAPSSTPAPTPSLIQSTAQPAGETTLATPDTLMLEGSFDDRSGAVDALSQELGFGSAGCDELRESAIACENNEIDTWQQLAYLNRVAVLQLRTPGRNERYIPVLSIDGDALTTITRNEHGETKVARLNTNEVGQWWTGKITYLWRTPAKYSGPIKVGAQSPMVAWTADQFARLDQRDERLADTVFTRALGQRVQLFQASVSLTADGYVGGNTIMKLRDAVEGPAHNLSLHPEARR